MAAQAYGFAAQPRALAGGSAVVTSGSAAAHRFRGGPAAGAAAVLASAATLPANSANIMFDRRVVRGSTYSLAQRLATGAPLLPGAMGPYESKQAGARRQLQSKARNKQQHPQTQATGGHGAGAGAAALTGGHELYGAVDPESAATSMPPGHHPARAATPPPVEGRVHLAIQTDNYLEDLREKKNKVDFATQTLAEMDRPSEPLWRPLEPIFFPQSEYKSVATMTVDDDLFDFDMHVEPLLDVLCSNGLEQAMMEVLAEEEQKEIDQQLRDFDQDLAARTNFVQRLRTRDDALVREAAARGQQELARRAEEQRKASRVVAAAAARDALKAAADAALVKMDDAGFFYDPVLRQVAHDFLPSLLASVETRIQAQAVSHAQLDDLVLRGLQEAVLQNAKARTAAPEDSLVKQASQAADAVTASAAASSRPGREIPKADQEFLVRELGRTVRRAAPAATAADLVRHAQRRTPAGAIPGARSSSSSSSSSSADSAAPVPALATTGPQPGKLRSGARVGGSDGDRGDSDDEGDDGKKAGGKGPSPSAAMGKHGAAPEKQSDKDKAAAEKGGKHSPSAGSSSAPSPAPSAPASTAPATQGATQALQKLASLPRALGFTPLATAGGRVEVGGMDDEAGVAEVANAPATTVASLEARARAQAIAVFGTGAQAGLARGDVVVALDDVAVTSPQELRVLLQNYQPGDSATLSVTRALDGRAERLAVEVGVAAGQLDQAQVRALRQAAGLALHPAPLLSKESALSLLLDASLELGLVLAPETAVPASAGVVAVAAPLRVVSVAPNGPAFRAGLQPHDVLVAVNGEHLQHPAHLESLLSADQPGSLASFQVVRLDAPRPPADRAAAVAAALAASSSSARSRPGARGASQATGQVLFFTVELGGAGLAYEMVQNLREMAGIALGSKVSRPSPATLAITVTDADAVADAVADPEHTSRPTLLSKPSVLPRATASISTSTSSTAAAVFAAPSAGLAPAAALAELQQLAPTLGLTAEEPSASEVETCRARLLAARGKLAQLTSAKRRLGRLAGADDVGEEDYEEEAEEEMEVDDDASLVQLLRLTEPGAGVGQGSVGLVVRAVEPFGGAGQAGLGPGDWIIKVNETVVTSRAQLERVVGAVLAGDVLHLDVLRALTGARDHLFVETHGTPRAAAAGSVAQSRVRALRRDADLTAVTEPLVDGVAAARLLAALVVETGIEFLPQGPDNTELVIAHLGTETSLSSGLLPGDRILRVHEAPVPNDEAVSQVLAPFVPGAFVTVTYARPSTSQDHPEDPALERPEHLTEIELQGRFPTRCDPALLDEWAPGLGALAATRTVFSVHRLRALASMALAHQRAAAVFAAATPDALIQQHQRAADAQRGLIAKLESLLLSSSPSSSAGAAAQCLAHLPACLGLSVRAAADGLVVFAVAPHASALQAGVVPGDVITHVNGAHVPLATSPADVASASAFLDHLLTLVQPGAPVALRLLRASDARAEDVTVEAGVAAPFAAAFPMSRIRELRARAHGVHANADTFLTAAQAAQKLRELTSSLGVKISSVAAPATTAGGVRVDKLKPNGPAARAGIREGDVILALGDVPLSLDAFPVPSPAPSSASAFASLAGSASTLSLAASDSAEKVDVFREHVRKTLPGTFLPVQILRAPVEAVETEPVPLHGVVWVEVGCGAPGADLSVEQVRSLRALAGKDAGAALLHATQRELLAAAAEESTATSLAGAGAAGLESLLAARAVGLSASAAQGVLRALPPGLGCAVQAVVLREDAQDGADPNGDGDGEQQPGLSTVAGLQILSVDPLGAAAQAELLERDLIIALAGEPVASLPALRRVLGFHQPGDVVTALVRRDGERDLHQVSLELSIDLLPFSYAPSSSSTPFTTPAAVSAATPLQTYVRQLRLAAGLPVSSLRLLSPAEAASMLASLAPNPDLQVSVAQTMPQASSASASSPDGSDEAADAGGADGEGDGEGKSKEVLVVLGVEPGSAAHAAGLADGDIILAVNGVEFMAPETHSAEQAYVSVLQALAPGDALTLEVQSSTTDQVFIVHLPTAAVDEAGNRVSHESLKTLRRIAHNIAVPPRFPFTPSAAAASTSSSSSSSSSSQTARGLALSPATEVSETGLLVLREEAASDLPQPATHPAAFAASVATLTAPSLPLSAAQPDVFALACALEASPATFLSVSPAPSSSSSSSSSARPTPAQREHISHLLSTLRPDLGMRVYFQSLTPEDAVADSAADAAANDASSAPHVGVVRVLSASRDGGAAAASIVPGDVILAVNGRDVTASSSAFDHAVRGLTPGTATQLVVRRSGGDGRVVHLSVEVGNTQGHFFTLPRVRAMRQAIGLTIPVEPVLTPAAALAALVALPTTLGFSTALDKHSRRVVVTSFNPAVARILSAGRLGHRATRAAEDEEEEAALDGVDEEEEDVVEEVDVGAAVQEGSVIAAVALRTGKASAATPPLVVDVADAHALARHVASLSPGDVLDLHVLTPEHLLPASSSSDHAAAAPAAGRGAPPGMVRLRVSVQVQATGAAMELVESLRGTLALAPGDCAPPRRGAVAV